MLPDQATQAEGALHRTASHSCCDMSPCATMSSGLMGASWSAAFVVGVITFCASLMEHHRVCSGSALCKDLVLNT